MSAAIVSGIVALVLAFVQKEKGPDARAKISNNPVMKEILGNMATKRGQHDEVFGYGSLKPFKVFGYGSHILWSVIENLPSIPVAPSGVDANHNTKVSKFILSETSVAMYSDQNIREIQAVREPVGSIVQPRIDQYPDNYHEDKDDRQIKPCPSQCLMKSILGALDYLKICRLANHVKVIHLKLPHLPPLGHSLDSLGGHRKLLLCDHVLPLIIESEVQVIERLVCPSINNIYMSDLCRFIKRLSESLLSGLKSIVLPGGLPFGVLCRIVEILNGCSTATVYVTSIGKRFSTDRDETSQEWQFPKVMTVKVICAEYVDEFYENIGFKNIGFDIPFNVTRESSDLVGRKAMPEDDDEPGSNDDELGSNDDEPCECLDVKLTHDDNSDTYHYMSQFSNNLELPKVTVALLGDAVDIHHKEIKNKIIPDGNFKCFTVPHGGTCEKDRHLGTLCATIIAGESNGMSPFVNLVYATVINAKARTKPEWVISALEWIEREHDNVDIVVIPLGFDAFNLGLFKIINKLSKNMIVVCAASNSRKPLMQEICYPAMYGDVICVGSHQGNTSRPSSFSPQGRELDLLVPGECVGFKCFSACKKPVPASLSCRTRFTRTLTDVITSTKYSLSGTCVAAANAAGFIAQIVAFALKCGFERQQITNNTVMRELLKHRTCNFSHDPHSGHGWINSYSKSELLENPDYFKKVVEEILSCDD